jgi:hypothetical protein
VPLGRILGLDIFSIENLVAVSLFGEKTLTILCEILVNRVARDYRVKARRATVSLGPKQSA